MFTYINMPPKRIRFVCTDRKLIQGEIRNRPGICFKKGIKAGFVAGLKKGQEQGQAQPPQPPAGGDVYDVINDFVQNLQLIAYPPVAVNFEPMEPPQVPIVPIQQAPPMQIPPPPAAVLFEPIEEEPVPAPLARQPRLGRRQRFREFMEQQRMGREDVNVTAQPAPQPPKKIGSNDLKKILGKTEYKNFITEIKDQAKKRNRKPQETLSKMGVIEYKILASFISATLNEDLTDEEVDLLSAVIAEEKKQGKIEEIRNNLFTALRSILARKQTGGGKTLRELEKDRQDGLSFKSKLEEQIQALQVQITYMGMTNLRPELDKKENLLKQLNEQIARIEKQMSSAKIA